MAIKTVTVCGSGVLGSQIAYQTAFHGFDVHIYDINAAAIEKAKHNIAALEPRYQEDLKASAEQIETATGRISYYTDLAQAVQGVELVIEAIPENLQIKQQFYSDLAQMADAKTIFTTNSSTLLPSQIMESTGRPEQFLALHFANEIWKFNIAEVMRTPKTDQASFDTVLDFAKQIGMVSVPIHKEKSGYILNSLLVPFLNAGLDLVVSGVADPQSVDKTWMIATGSPIGPFAMLDVIGLNTPYNIRKGHLQDDPSQLATVEYLKARIDAGKLGKATGEGFYQYPDPAYLDKDFLK